MVVARLMNQGLAQTGARMKKSSSAGGWLSKPVSSAARTWNAYCPGARLARSTLRPPVAGALHPSAPPSRRYWYRRAPPAGVPGLVKSTWMRFLRREVPEADPKRAGYGSPDCSATRTAVRKIGGGAAPFGRLGV